MNILRTETTGDAIASPMSRSVRVGMALLLALTVSGCAAFHPLQGVPASYIPEKYLGPSRSGKETIDLSLLVQRQPDQYRLAAGDILSVYVPGVLGSLRVSGAGDIGETPPINLPQSPDDPPTIGYPTAVRDDGTISLPLVPPINVNGLTLAEAEATVREAYTVHANILNDERERVLISLARRREYRVLVVRQETSSELSAGAQPGTINIGASKRGTARVVRLPAYENDVLHALAKAEGGADGLPGLDAENTIYVIRRKPADPAFEMGPVPTFDGPPRGFIDSPIRTQDEPAIDVIEPPLPHPEPPPPEAWLKLQPSEEPFERAEVIRGPGRAPDADSASQRAGQTPSAPAPAAAPAVPSSGGLDPQSPRDQSDDGILDIPLWPRPAKPAQSIQRTSAHGPPVWGHAAGSVVRSQSPGLPAMGRSALGHTGFGHSLASPYGTGSRGVAPAAGMSGWRNMDVGGHDLAWHAHLGNFDPTVNNPNVIKIPIRLAPGECPIFTEQDIILHDGDIVFIESRETEVFYTGGLLGGGQYTLPRDYDLGVLEAISIAQSPQNARNQTTRSIGGVSALNMDVTFSASHVVILRKLINGTRMPIEVDLYKALRKPETENVLIQPGDMIILQYTKMEAICALLERHLLEGALFGIAAAQFNNNGGGF